MTKKIENIQKLINIKFKDENLLKQAITHKSYNSKINYEKLEFLGDRVLGLIISKKLLEIYPDEKEGILDKKLASLTTTRSSPVIREQDKPRFSISSLPSTANNLNGAR